MNDLIYSRASANDIIDALGITETGTYKCNFEITTDQRDYHIIEIWWDENEPQRAELITAGEYSLYLDGCNIIDRAGYEELLISIN